MSNIRFEFIGPLINLAAYRDIISGEEFASNVFSEDVIIRPKTVKMIIAIVLQYKQMIQNQKQKGVITMPTSKKKTVAKKAKTKAKMALSAPKRAKAKTVTKKI